MRPPGIGRSRVRAMRSSMSWSMYMLTALAPPAIRYPPTITSRSVNHDGLPAMYIGAAVVTSSSEMIRGLVSITRSAARLRWRWFGDDLGHAVTPFTGPIDHRLTHPIPGQQQDGDQRERGEYHPRDFGETRRPARRGSRRSTRNHGPEDGELGDKRDDGGGKEEGTQAGSGQTGTGDWGSD